MLTITNQNIKQIWIEYKLNKKNVFINICSWYVKVKLESEFTVGIIHIDWEQEFWNNVIE